MQKETIRITNKNNKYIKLIPTQYIKKQNLKKNRK